MGRGHTGSRRRGRTRGGMAQCVGIAVAFVVLLTGAPQRGLSGQAWAAGAPCNSGTETTSGTTVTCTYSYTGAEQQFTVPADVSSVTVTAVGGTGGASPNPSYGTPGGRGDVITAPLSGLAAGSTLYVEVGGNGGYSSNGTPGTGGFNGGGSGGSGNKAYSNLGGGGGGGASDVRTLSRGTSTTNDNLTTRLVVASGGGGSTYNSYAGGGGGGNGDAAPDNLGSGGYGASGASGGTGGSPNGASGGTGYGGAGGDTTNGFGGGGSTGTAGFGGGGGSDLVPAGGSTGRDSTGIPEVVITYTLGSAPCTGASCGGTATPELGSGELLLTGLLPLGLVLLVRRRRARYHAQQ